MRPNRNIRIGAVLIVLALIVWAGYSLISRRGGSSSNGAPANVAENNAAGVNPVDNGLHNVSMPAGGGAFKAVDFIPERTIITADMFKPAPYPGEHTNDAVHDPLVTDIMAQAVGYITARPMSSGHTLEKADLIGHITQVGMAGAIRPGFRAMVVPIVNKPTLHDLVRIGDYVDIIAAFDQQESRAIVQNVRVLAVDIYGKDFPQVRVAMRGTNKAEPRGVGYGNSATPGTVAGRPVGEGTPAPGPTPTPTPGGPPPAAPEPALMLEVTPDQATALSLAAASNSPLDYIIHPTSDNLGAPGGATTPGLNAAAIRTVAITKPQLAPYADRVKKGATAAANATRVASAPAGTARGAGRGTSRQGLRDIYGGPGLPPPGIGNAGVPPMTVAAPKTYDIPIYADGRSVRVDTVRKPDDAGDTSAY